MFVCKWWWHLLLLSRRKWTSYQDTDTWTIMLSWRSKFKNDLSLTILEENSKVIIRTSDTDVLVIALGCLEHIPESINLWLEVGLYAKNSLRYIDVRKLFNKLGKDLCRSLPTSHVFAGSDYTAAFPRKGKIRPLRHLRRIYKKKNSKSLKSLLAPYMKNQNLILSMRYDWSYSLKSTYQQRTKNW